MSWIIENIWSVLAAWMALSVLVCLFMGKFIAVGMGTDEHSD